MSPTETQAIEVRRMFRRGSQALMFIGLLVCIASLLETALTRSATCPICGLRAAYQATYVDPRAIQNGDAAPSLDLYYCKPCDTGVME